MWTNKKAQRWKRYYLYNCTSRRENWGAFGALSLSLVFFFNARLGYDISAHEYGMYRDTCSLSYEFEIATFLMSLQPGTRLCLLRIYFIQNEILLCFRFRDPLSNKYKWRWLLCLPVSYRGKRKMWNVWQFREWMTERNYPLPAYGVAINIAFPGAIYLTFI